MKRKLSMGDNVLFQGIKCYIKSYYYNKVTDEYIYDIELRRRLNISEEELTLYVENVGEEGINE